MKTRREILSVLGTLPFVGLLASLWEPKHKLSTVMTHGIGHLQPNATVEIEVIEPPYPYTERVTATEILECYGRSPAEDGLKAIQDLHRMEKLVLRTLQGGRNA